MNCLTDSICSATIFFDWIQSSLAAIDYYGTLAFGAEWRAIGPELADQIDVIGEVLRDWFEEPQAGCQRYASLGDFNA
ncbi:MAG: hypothetical protein AAFX10_06700 [Pseudomonadota bacterium]